MSKKDFLNALDYQDFCHFKSFYWNVLALQCVNFCCTAK